MNKKKINIFIATRKRYEYLRYTLHYLNKINAKQKYDVVVYIGDDSDLNLRINSNLYGNLIVQFFYFSCPSVKKLFCRGHIINKLIQKARDDYDYLMIADNDMVYNDNIFEVFDKHFENPQVKWITMHGSRTKIQDFNQIKNNYSLSFQQIKDKFNPKKSIGTSSIAITKICHDEIKEKFKIDNLYNFENILFEGWGWEDRVIKETLTKHTQNHIVENMWIHLEHERSQRNAGGNNSNQPLVQLVLNKRRKRLNDSSK